MSITLEIPIYKTAHFEYIRIRDLPEGYERLELERWVFGKLQPLIQGSGKGVREIQDAVFVSDYLEYLDYKAGKYAFVS